MPEDLMRYDLLAQNALRGVVREALRKVARDGLPGEHHFYIAFLTKHPGVVISDRLAQRYPREMTIVLQHQYYGLQVFEDLFEVELSFDNIPEKLVVPFSAVKGFLDPAVQFGLQFEVQAVEPAATVHAKPAPAPAALKADPETDTKTPESAPQAAAEKVISLDSFRKK